MAINVQAQGGLFGGPFEIRDAPGRGLGLFATTTIFQGQTIISEIDRISVYRHLWDLNPIAEVQKLEPWQKAHLSALHGRDPVPGAAWNPPASGVWQDTDYANVLDNNAFDIKGSTGQWPFRAIFHIICRINHSCLPTAVGKLTILLGTDSGSFATSRVDMTVRACTTIHPGEEITLDYHPSFRWESALERYAWLRDNRGFHCECAICNGKTQMSKNSDKRRHELQHHIDVVRPASRNVIAMSRYEEADRYVKLVEKEFGGVEPPSRGGMCRIADYRLVKA